MSIDTAASVRRHILTVGPVDPATVAFAADAWKADEVDGELRKGDVLLALFDPVCSGSAAFVGTLTLAGELGIAVGTLPIYGPDRVALDLNRLLGCDRISVDFSQCRFRLGGSAETTAADAPLILCRATRDSAEAVREDIENADLLFLQGHSGPVDGSFGKWMTLCSRGLTRDDRPPFFPCADDPRCFRQLSQGRAEDSLEGLIDPRLLRSALLVADGCGTFPVPGSLYRYEQSLLRGLMLGAVSTSVLSLGVSATPLSVVVLFMAMLAQGRTLGEAVMAANHLRRESGSPSSIERAAVAPWVLVGNPAAVVTGIPLVERTAEWAPDGSLQFVLAHDANARETGTLVALNVGNTTSTSLSAVCEPPAWAHGVVRGNGNAYLWLAPPSIPRDAVDLAGSTRVTLIPRRVASAASWRECLFWLRAGSQWLTRVAETLAGRSRANDSLLELIALRHELADAFEQAVYAAAPNRPLEIASDTESPFGMLRIMLGEIDRATATQLAAAIPFAGARLSHLWSPPWPHDGTASVDETCLCGCAIVGHVRRHPLYDLRRIELSCPACSLIGDAAASLTSTDAVRATLKASILERSPAAGQTLGWRLKRASELCDQGFASATLFDPYRTRLVITTVTEVPPDQTVTISLAIPEDWPLGLGWATLTFTAGGRISMFAFDLDIRASDDHPN